MDENRSRASKWDLLKSIDVSCGEVSDSLDGAADDIVAAIHEIRDLLRATLPSGDWMSEIVDRVVEVLRARRDEPEQRARPVVGVGTTGDHPITLTDQDAEIARLREEVREWEDAAQGAENPHPDEEHCACVGPLRATIARLREEVERLTGERDRAIAMRDAITRKGGVRDVIQRIPPHPERAHALRILDAALAAPEPGDAPDTVTDCSRGVWEKRQDTPEPGEEQP